MASSLTTQTAAALSRSLQAGELSALEITDAFIERTQKVDTSIHAFNSSDPELARTLARESDQRRSRGETRGPLDGVPVALKDVIAMEGQPLTCSSRMLENFVSPYDSHVSGLLREAGAVFWGRTNLDEFAMGSSTENSAFGVTANPWDLERVPGGSSGGSAACVAAGEVPLSLGSDTGGSIRQPAAFCGVVGMKPTYGLVSRYGLVAFASSLDQIGPFARDVADVALLLQAVAGHDRRDSTSYRTEIPDYTQALEQKCGPWKLGIPREYFAEGLGDEIRARVDEAIAWYQQQGHEIVEVSLPHTDLALPVYYVIATAEASSNLARYDGVRYTHRSEKEGDAVDMYFNSRAEGFGDEVKRRIILGSYVLSSGYYDAYYKRAQKIRSLIRKDFSDAFAKVDALLTPTTPTPAFRRGEKATDPLAMYLNDIFTINVNLAGLPALSLPCGFTGDGLPVGLQVIGKPYEEAELLAVAHAYDQAHQWGHRRPEPV